MTSLKLTFFGSPQVELDGEHVTFNTRKALALLSYITVTHQPHSREKLASIFWPNFSSERAFGNLRGALRSLTKQLTAHWFDISRLEVAIKDASDLWVDVFEFQHLCDRVSEHAHTFDSVCDHCFPSVLAAIELYQGDFLQGFTLPDCPAFDEWQASQTDLFRKQLVEGLHMAVRYAMFHQELQQAIHYARRWVDVCPWSEAAHRELMWVYALNHQRSEALHQYQECVRMLQEEFEAEPQHETQELYEAILHEDLTPEFSHLLSPQKRRSSSEREGASPSSPSRREAEDGVPHNLPAQTTSFIGRKTEIEAVEEMLARPDVRLLTLTGPGGSGKTRLGLQVAADLLDEFTHGVWFVALAPIRDSEYVIPAIAQTLGVRVIDDQRVVEGDPLQVRLQEYLREKQMLLLLDNVEQMLEAASQINELLTAAPGLKVLTTSRVSLRVSSEHNYPVPPSLPFPDPNTRSSPTQLTQYTAVQLFIERARAVQADFILTNDNVPAVADICARLEGLPLAIELAAAWICVLTPAEILAEIDQGLDFLTTDFQDVPERQRSIRAVFHSMWNLLTEREQEVFRGVSVFRGGFSRKAIQQVTGASLQDVRALVNKSLLRTTPAGRYEIHELLRQYAAEHLEHSPAAIHTAIHDRHSAYYVAQLQQWASDVKGPQQQAALAEIETESENVRAAWYWAVEREHIDAVMQAMDGLGHFYARQGRYQEGAEIFRVAAEKLTAVTSGEGVRVVARLLLWQGRFHRELGRTEQASKLVQRSLDILNSTPLADQDIRSERALAFLELGLFTMNSNLEESRLLFEHSLKLYRSVDDLWATATVLELLGNIAFHHVGHRDEAKTYFEESLRLRKSQKDRVGIATSLKNLSWILARAGELEEAERLVKESIDIYQQIGDRTGIAKGFLSLANTHLYHGEFVNARPLYEKSLAIFSELEMRTQLAVVNELLGWNKINLGLYEEAQSHLRTSLMLFQESGNQPATGLAYLGLGEVEIAREAYVKARNYLETGLAIIREVGQPEEESLIFLGLGYIAIELGHLSQARQYYWEALHRAIDIDSFAPTLFSIAAVAFLLARQDEPERAIELHALVSRHPYFGNSRYWDETIGRHITTVAATLPPEVVATAQERGRQRDLYATAKELLAELER